MLNRWDSRMGQVLAPDHSFSWLDRSVVQNKAEAMLVWRHACLAGGHGLPNIPQH